MRYTGLKMVILPLTYSIGTLYSVIGVNPSHHYIAYWAISISSLNKDLTIDRINQFTFCLIYANNLDIHLELICFGPFSTILIYIDIILFLIFLERHMLLVWTQHLLTHSNFMPL